MTKIRYLIFFVSGIFFMGCRSSVSPDKELRLQIDSLVNMWVPDSREGICKVDFKNLSDNEILLSGETNLPLAKEDILRYLENAGIKYRDSLKVLPDPVEIDNPWGLVSVSVCNLKKNPSHAGELVSQAIMGTPVKILKKEGSWLLIQTPDYYIGWSTESGIKELNGKEMTEWRKSDRLIYDAKSGEILSENVKDDVISDIVKGSIINLISRQGTYYIVELPDGRKGKIEMKYCQDFNKWCSEAKPDPDKLIAFAESLKGIPYLWGGTSTKMADCSGFLKTVYFTGGVILARDASQQFRYGMAVDISSSFDSLKPGDQVFFGHLNSSGNKVITHTGMYIGDTEIIHESGMVRVNSLDSTRSNYNSFLRKTIMGARRIIGNSSGKGTDYVVRNGWYNLIP